MERNPTLLRLAANKKSSHGLWRTEHQTSPLPSVDFYCVESCAVRINRFDARTFQMRWVLLRRGDFESASNHESHAS